MSDVLYPLAPIGTLDVARISRTIKDEFEDGSQQSRRLWSEKNFKRRFTVKHQNLTRQEFEILSSFLVARDGGYDSFWFRDNWNYGGNAKVRLASDLPIDRGGAPVYSPQLVLEEVAPVRALPSFAEVATAAGQTGNGGLFHVWLDANREVEYTNSGDESLGIVYTSTLKNFARNDTSYPAYDLSAVHTANFYGKLNSISAQYQSFWSHYWPSSTYRNRWKSSSFNSLSGSTQPAVTLFALVKHGTSSSANKVLFGIGNAGTGLAHGIQLRSDNYYAPWLGGAESWGTAQYQNSAADTWRSIAVTWPAASNSASLYVNGALIGTEAETRNYAGGSIFLGAAPDDTLMVGAQSFNNAIQHAMMWSAELTLAQIKALHNLFAYQYGMTTV